MKKPILAVVRGFMPRMAQIYFYSQFKHFQVRFIGHDIPSGTEEFKDRIEFVDLPFKPFYGFDPLSLRGKIDNYSWLGLVGLEKWLKDVDLIETYISFYFYSRQAAVLAKKLNKPLVFSCWEVNPDHPGTWLPPYCFNVKKVIPQINLFILKSKLSHRFLDRFKIESQKRKQIYMGIDTKRFKPGRREEGKRILYVGRLAKFKGLEDLLEAFRIVNRQRKETELWLVGDGPLRKKISRLAVDLPVRFFGWQFYEKIPAFYRQADLICIPSRTIRYFGLLKRGEEMFSYTAMEAMASGLPVVATRVGGLKESLAPGNIWIKEGDVVGLAKGIMRFLSDKNLREKVGGNNRKFALKTYNLEKQAWKTEAAMLKLL